MNIATETLATKAVNALVAELVMVPKNDWTMNEYDHVMLCHGCGRLHAVRASFISTPLSIQFNFPDGSRLDIPAHGCKFCLAAPGQIIRHAYYEGMTRSAYDEAAKRVGANPSSDGWRGRP